MSFDTRLLASIIALTMSGFASAQTELDCGIILTADQVVDGSSSEGYAEFSGFLDPDTASLSGNTFLLGMTGPFTIDIHEGAPGSNGPVVMELSTDGKQFGQVRLFLITSLSQDNIAGLQSGNYYVDVHTDAFPDGEVRAQIECVSGSPSEFSFTLGGGQEVPAVDTAAQGVGFVRMNAAQSQLTVFVAHDVAGVSAAHIHGASTGENGAILFPLGDGTSPIDAVVNDITPDDATDLLNGAFYSQRSFNIEPHG